MGWLEDFWANINAGATTIATAPDPVINIVNAGGNTQTKMQGGNRPSGTSSGGTKCYKIYGQEMQLSQQAVDYYRSIGQNPIRCTTGGAEPTNHAYVRPTFAHDSDKYGFDYLYGERDFRSDEDIWKKGIEPLHKKHQEQQAYIDKKIEGLYDTRRTKKEVEQILINYYGDDIARLDQGHADQEGRISEKAGIGHTHNGNGGDMAWYVKIALIIAGTFLVYFIIRRKFLR